MNIITKTPNPWNYTVRRPECTWTEKARFEAFRRFLFYLHLKKGCFDFPGELKRKIFGYVMWELLLVERMPRHFDLPVQRTKVCAPGSLKCIHLSAAFISNNDVGGRDPVRKIRVRVGLEILDPSVKQWLVDTENRVIASQLPEIHNKLYRAVKGNVVSYTFDVVPNGFMTNRWDFGCDILEHSIVVPFLEEYREVHVERDQEYGQVMQHCFGVYRRIPGVFVPRDSYGLRFPQQKRPLSFTVGAVLGEVSINVTGMTCCKHRASKMKFSIIK